MLQNKFIRILIIINGIILPIFISVGLYQLLKSSWKDDDYYEPESIIVGEKLNKAKSGNKALQGLYYDNPNEIYNSSNMYLALSAMTYEQAKQLKEVASSAGDVSWSFYNIFNIVFLDKDYNVVGTLLNKKASITDIDIPRGNYNNATVDTTVQNIAYFIAFTDTNNDGLLDKEDFHDLYISDLNGKNLTQVTSNIDLESYYFINNHSEIFITYKERTNQREEHKRKKFARYYIKTKRFVKLDRLDKQLDIIEEKLTH